MATLPRSRLPMSLRRVAVFVNWGVLFWVSKKQEPYYLGPPKAMLVVMLPESCYPSLLEHLMTEPAVRPASPKGWAKSL